MAFPCALFDDGVDPDQAEEWERCNLVVGKDGGIWTKRSFEFAMGDVVDEYGGWPE